MPEVVVNDEEPRAGFFGKLPKHGDFLTRRLPRVFTDPWDQWLQNAIADSKEQLADDWLNIYLTSPLWRFALSSGLCGERVWTGVLMPSVDRVGRYFPLTLAVSLDKGTDLMSLVIDNDAWFNRCEELMLGALGEDAELEAFDRDVASLELPVQRSECQALGKERTTKPAWHFDLPSLESIDSSMAGLGQTLLKKLLSSHSLWWTYGSERVRPSLLIAEGFPPIEGYAGLLDGNWNNWGWGQYSLQPGQPAAPQPPVEQREMTSEMEAETDEPTT